jgi:hypothetical protein
MLSIRVLDYILRLVWGLTLVSSNLAFLKSPNSEVCWEIRPSFWGNYNGLYMFDCPIDGQGWPLGQVFGCWKKSWIFFADE